MKLCLLRHGDAVCGNPDAERPLSDTGVEEAQLAGTFLAATKEIPDLICHSTLLRSRQTAVLAARRLGGEDRLLECTGLCPGDSPQEFASRLHLLRAKDILVVGHLPFLGELASYLLSGSTDTICMRFTTGTLLALECKTSVGAWALRFHASSKLIARLLRS